MIEIKKAEVLGIDGAIRGMRNPMNSWNKSDSGICEWTLSISPYCDKGCKLYKDGDCLSCFFTIGENDMALCKKLIKAGTDHRKFMRMIHVQADVLAPLYWWKHLEQYKVGTTTNSTSTMHKIHAKEFTLDDFSHEHLTPMYMYYLEKMIVQLNSARQDYLATKDKTYWWQIIQLLPSSYNQLRTIDLNYEVLLTIYHARKNHKLDE